MEPAALLLTPGAGADRSQPQLVAVDEALSALGWTVARMDFPYRLAGRRAPDRPPVLLAMRSGKRTDVTVICALPPPRLAFLRSTSKESFIL